MNPTFTVNELNRMHLAIITRERVIREDWIPSSLDPERRANLAQEADELATLGRKVCAAQLSKEMGFHIEPVPA